MRTITISIVLALSFLLAQSVPAAQVAYAPNVVELKAENFRKVIDGKQVDLYTIQNQNGMIVRITNYGAKVQQIIVPDKKGVFADVAQGYETIDQVVGGQGSMGAFVGRYANRIGGAKFTLEGKEYQLAANNGKNSLHGGEKGSRFQVFNARQLSPGSVEMTYVFKDGEENYPAMQLYSGNFLEGKTPRDLGKGKTLYIFRSAFCMEPSHFPDSPNKPQFPSTVLQPGQWYTGKIVYKFSAKN